MSVRPATASDLPAIRALLAACALPHADLDGPALALFSVAPGAAGLDGVVGLEPYGDAALLRSLAVAPAVRGRGLGQALVDAAEAAAGAHGHRALYLLTTTAAEFFAARGYQRIARDQAPAALHASTEFATLCPASAVCMTKALPC
jgi:amino-acid N-acetyltransferase